MSETLEQVYYEFLTRTDHPVLYRDFSTSTDISSPVNSIWNRVLAKQMVKMRALVEEMRLNANPETVDELTIDDWENQYFGFTKPQLPLAQRVSELLLKFRKQYSMSISDVIGLSQAIVGVTPIVTRNVGRQGWVLGTGVLGVSTTLTTSSSSATHGLYLVYFPVPVDSSLLAKLDTALTLIEKAGSRHVIKSQVQYWILGKAALGIDTVLGV